MSLLLYRHQHNLMKMNFLLDVRKDSHFQEEYIVISIKTHKLKKIAEVLLGFELEALFFVGSGWAGFVGIDMLGLRMLGQMGLSVHR